MSLVNSAVTVVVSKNMLLTSSGKDAEIIEYVYVVRSLNTILTWPGDHKKFLLVFARKIESCTRKRNYNKTNAGMFHVRTFLKDTFSPFEHQEKLWTGWVVNSLLKK